MRHFTDELRGAVYKVRHTKINDLDKAGSSSGEVEPVLRPGREWAMTAVLRSGAKLPTSSRT
ncbi:hypothetical protein [Rhizobium sp. 2MFCol3.1]|uniref:hypothetical protein n=1 Tax=Rhizobium sp. 2MFCol3.1 TaxID=1246459 RepID=UPI000475B53D|nr:hypothetical protein [Rhizobium sp. 2MFCol3.1]